MAESVKNIIKDYKSDQTDFSLTLAQDIETTFKIDEFYDLDLDKIISTIDQAQFTGIQNQKEIIKTIIKKSNKEHSQEDGITNLLISIKPDANILTPIDIVEILHYFSAAPLCEMLNPEYFKNLEENDRRLKLTEDRLQFIMYQMEEFFIPINIVNQSDANQISSLYIPKNDSNNDYIVNKLKDHIKHLLKLRGDSEIDLYHNNILLNDGSKKVQELNLKSSSIIYYNIIRNDSCIQIYLKKAEEELKSDTSQRVDPIEIKTTDKVQVLKEHIEREFSIVSRRQKLKFYKDGSETVVDDDSDDKLLKEIGIDKNHIVVVVEEGPEPVKSPDPDQQQQDPNATQGSS